MKIKILMFLFFFIGIKLQAQSFFNVIGEARQEIIHQIGTEYTENHDNSGRENITQTTPVQFQNATYAVINEYYFDHNEICDEYISITFSGLIDITVSFLNQHFQNIDHNVWYDKQKGAIIKLDDSSKGLLILDYKRQ
jgi:hypothetical protein